MNIVFLSFDGQTCIQTWSEDVSSLYYLLEKEHSVTWIGEKQHAEVEKFHQAISGKNIPWIPLEYAQLFGKLLSDIINQACYDLVICCKEVLQQYLVTNTPIISMNNTEEWTEGYIRNILSEIRKNTDVYIPVYAINMKERKDRRRNIINEFEGKTEFELHLVDACVHRKGAIGLWNSMVQIVRMAKENKDDYVIICEDDHYFTENYSPKLLIREIQEAFLQGAEVLSGGIGGFGKGFPAGFRRYWVDWFWCTQFIVVYASLFDKILSYEFKEEDVADEVISVLATNKMVIYPFISEQKDFGYSDVTQNNDENKGLIRSLFNKANDKFEKIEKYSPYVCN